METLLEVKDLHTYFHTDIEISRAVEGISFHIDKAQVLALVGESGCGKTVTALSIMRLVPHPGKIMQGEIIFQGQNLLNMSESKMRSIRGGKIGMVFQEPMSSLNPLYTIGYQISETLLAHKKMPKRQIKEQVLHLLARVEIPSSEHRYSDYPHNLSGGLRQRAMIAQGLACNPELLIADEPTTALDATIQVQILELFARLKKTTQMSLLLITHDLGVVAEIADRVCIMYAGKIVEEADVFSIFKQPQHPYTKGLLGSISASAEFKPRERLPAIPGVVPHPADKPSGCPFHTRCNKADEYCSSAVPQTVEVGSGHKVSCWKVR